jgi:lipopolysaccharide/colanic/teichoic acid biosynthesis glycosyltransferase
MRREVSAAEIGVVLDGDGALIELAPARDDVLRPAAAYQRAVKPALDMALGLALSVLLLPLILAVALTVRVKLGKGVIYRQTRIGRNGTPFMMYKFRSMAPDRRRSQQPFEGRDRRTCHKRDDDPRHTPCGRFLRRASFDELPQLWNVIKGDMSLVGPRPELPQIVSRYEPWQHRRHEVKPGLTGFWQVSDRAGGLAYESVGLDLDYIRRMSFWTDLGVLLRTVPVTLRRTGR